MRMLTLSKYTCYVNALPGRPCLLFDAALGGEVTIEGGALYHHDGRFFLALPAETAEIITNAEFQGLLRAAIATYKESMRRP